MEGGKEVTVTLATLTVLCCGEKTDGRQEIEGYGGKGIFKKRSLVMYYDGAFNSIVIYYRR